MIQTVEGKLGGGKTYMVTGFICNHLAKGGIVATNINYKLDPFENKWGKNRGLREVLRTYYGYILKDEQIIRLSDVNTIPYTNEKGQTTQLKEITMFYKLVPRGTPEMPVLIAIDEAHMHFPNDGWRSIPREVMEFMTLSRHAGCDIIFISQHIKNMWNQMQRLAEFRWGVRDMKKYGFTWMLINWPWPFPHFMKVKKDSEGERMKVEFELKKKYLLECYDSPDVVASFESMPAANNVEIEKAVMTVKEKYLLFGGGFLCALLMLALPACMVAKNTETNTVEEQGARLVEAPEKNVKTLEKTQVVEEVKEQIEYYVAHVSDDGWNSRLYTTKRTYHIADMYKGFPVVKVEYGKLVTFDLDNNQYHNHYFQPQPH